MPLLHDPAVRTQIETRLKALTPKCERQWGSMTCDQMLWHVNQVLEFSLGESSAPVQKPPIPLPILKFLVIRMPWTKGAPTHKSAVAKEHYDFETERAKCLGLIGKFVSRPIDSEWPVDPAFGKVTGKFASQLQAKHLDHHFRQFSS